MMRPLHIALIALALGGCSLQSTGPIEEARVAYEAQDYFAAREAVLNALQNEPANAEALTMLARIQLVMGQGADALVTLERLKSAGGAAHDAAILEAEALLLTGQIDLALATLGQDESAESWRLRALAAAMRGNDQQAGEFFRAGREAPGDRRKLFTAAATFHLERGDADAARYAVGQAQQLAPAAIETLFVSARLAELDGRPDMASRAYLAILEDTPNDRPALVGAIRALDALGRDDLVRPLIARGRAAYPGDVDFIYLDASMLAFDGNWRGVRELLQQHEAQIAAHDDARGLYAQSLLALGQLEQARALMAPLNRRYPSNAAYARVYTRILLELEEYSQARAVMAPILAGPDVSELDHQLSEQAARG